MASTTPTANAHANASGHRQPGETCAREAERPGSQGTNAVRGTWCSEGEAGRHLRTKAGQAGHPGGARDSEPAAHPAATGTDRHSGTAVSRHGVHHARPSSGRGDAGTGIPEPQPAQRPWRGPGHMAEVQGEPGNQPRGITRKTRQRNVLSATGRSPSDPQKQRQAPTAGASSPGGQDRGQGRGDAVGGDLRAGFLRLFLWLPPGRTRIKPCTRYVKGCSKTGWAM